MRLLWMVLLPLLLAVHVIEVISGENRQFDDVGEAENHETHWDVWGPLATWMLAGKRANPHLGVL